MAGLPDHLVWLRERHGSCLSATLASLEDVHLTPDAAIAAFAKADPTPGGRLTDWMVRTYLEHASFRFEDVRSGLQSTVGTTLGLFVERRGTLPPDRRNINLYDSPGALWQAVGGDVVAKPSKREDRDRARAESRILVEDERGIVAVPLTEYASCWWGRGTRWCTAAREGNAFHDYAKSGPLFIMIAPDGSKAQFHVSPHGVTLKNAADNDVSMQGKDNLVELLDPIVRWAVDTNGGAIEFGSETVKRDRDFILRALRSKSGVTMSSIRSFCDDEDIMRTAVSGASCMMSVASERLGSNKAFVINAVKCHGHAIAFAQPCMQNDLEVVMEAVRTSGGALAFASHELQANRLVVMEAVSHFGEALEYAGPALQDDREIVMAAVRRTGSALRYACAVFQDDKEIVMAAVAAWGGAIQYANKRFLMDRDVVDLALANDGNALAYLPVTDRNDPVVVLKAVTTSGYALRCATQAIRCRRTVVLAAVRQSGQALEYADRSLRGDRSIVMEAVNQAGSALLYASRELQNDPLVVAAAVGRNGYALMHASMACQDDKDIVLTALAHAPSMFRYASERLQEDAEVMAMAGVTPPLDFHVYDLVGLEWPEPENAMSSPAP